MLTSAAATAARGGDPQRAAWAATQLVFAAPEQLRGECTPASDQYALAAIAYLLLTSRPPFTGDAQTLPSAILQRGIIVPSQLNPELLEDTDQVFLRALAKDPGDRFPSIEAFAQALDDSLAASAASAHTASGLTQQFSRLAGSQPGTSSPAQEPSAALMDGPSASLSGVRHAERGGASASGVRRAGEAAVVPGDAPPTVNRRLAIITGVAVLIAVLACAIGLPTFEGASILPRLKLGGQSASGPASAPTANVAATATAHAGINRLKGVTAGQPAFKDALTANSHHWYTSGKTIFFAADGLHVHNSSAASIAATDSPSAATAQAGNIVARVTMTMAQGNAGDVAGLRFFVAPASDGSADFFCYLISAEGRYEVWERHHDEHQNIQWDFVSGGFSSAIKTGLNQQNMLTVYARGADRDALLYANDQFIAEINLNGGGPTAGNTGLMVLDNGGEAVFSDFQVYNLGG
jgi:hypothetical protein